MPIDDDNERPNTIIAGDHQHVDRLSTLTTAFVLSLLVLAFYSLQTVLLPFVLSGLIAYICTPLLDWLAARTRLPRALFAVLAFFCLLGAAAGFGYVGLPPLIKELAKIATDSQGTIESLVRSAIGDRSIDVLGTSMNSGQISQAVLAALRDWMEHAGRLAQIGSMTFAAAVGVLITLVLLFYFLLGGRDIMTGLLHLVPPKERPLVMRIWSYLDPVLKRYFLGVACVVAYAIVAAYVGLGFILHVPHAVFLAVLTGILEMIPIVGPAASAAIAGLVAIRHAAGFGSIIAYAIYAVALRLSIDQFFSPVALGTAARLNPAMIIFCFLAGGVLFGIIGILMSVPVALAVKTTLSVLYDEPPPAPSVRTS